jgi:hypothetical protein
MIWRFKIRYRVLYGNTRVQALVWLHLYKPSFGVSIVWCASLSGEMIVVLIVHFGQRIWCSSSIPNDINEQQWRNISTKWVRTWRAWWWICIEIFPLCYLSSLLSCHKVKLVNKLSSPLFMLNAFSRNLTPRWLQISRQAHSLIERSSWNLHLDLYLSAYWWNNPFQAYQPLTRIRSNPNLLLRGFR